jgi:hypothetical protein
MFGKFKVGGDRESTSELVMIEEAEEDWAAFRMMNYYLEILKVVSSVYELGGELESKIKSRA